MEAMSGHAQVLSPEVMKDNISSRKWRQGSKKERLAMEQQISELYFRRFESAEPTVEPLGTL